MQRDVRNFTALTLEYIFMRLERIDEQLSDPANRRRMNYLTEQREWWEKTLEMCRMHDAKRQHLVVVNRENKGL